MAKADSGASGIVLLAKRRGLTSFASLKQVKIALGTNKVGHTGTLDSFADGLLVVLSGSLTHLVPHFSQLRKTYRAVVCFGQQTDTLDPTGKITKTRRAATKDEVSSALEHFRGQIMQVPPEYSALHVAGRRASDLVREGHDVRLDERKVFIWENELEDFRKAVGLSYALLKVTCSKGTYIRALARDIGASVGSCAHLVALRRIKVGPFKLEDAAGQTDLAPFSIESTLLTERATLSAVSLQGDSRHTKTDQVTPDAIRQIRNKFTLFTPQLASSCGFERATLKEVRERDFANGKPLKHQWFDGKTGGSAKEWAVFNSSGDFAGIVLQADGRLSYGFTVPRGKRTLRVFSWESFLSPSFPADWKAKGIALTVGSFEALHAGHIELIKTVRAQKHLVSGVITFSTSIKSSSKDNCTGDVFTLQQRLAAFERLGLDFAVVAEFTQEFSEIEGEDFIDTLISLCGMKFMAEGGDFRCGRGGRLSMERLGAIASEKGFTLCCVPDVLFEGQKISSGRVKREIQGANFDAVHPMLGRPFAFDTTGLVWEKRTSGTSVTWEAQSEGAQVLPQDGVYCVRVLLEDGSFFRTSAQIQGGKLTLYTNDEDALNTSAAKITAIEFEGAQ